MITAYLPEKVLNTKMGIEEKFFNDLIEKDQMKKLNCLEINFLYSKYEELEPAQKKYVNSMITNFLNDREYCEIRGITYSTLEETKDPRVQRELIADAYRIKAYNFRRNSK